MILSNNSLGLETAWHALISPINKIANGIDNKKFFAGVFLDLSWQDGKRVHCKYLPLSHTKP